MAIGKDRAVVRQLRTLFNVGAIRELTDGQLLERFATGRGEPAELAFAVLLERHGPMVLRVCRAVLADAQDTQDAFQATFLVLVEKARGLWVQDSLGPWLHQVAYRTASSARSAAARRRRHETCAAAMAPREGRAEPDAELSGMLHEEIEGLPDRYRVPLVLCDLQGRSHDQAARHLGWPVGTVKSRLSRGRQRLRDRLIRRGVSPTAGLLAAAPRLDRADATVPSALVDSTTSAAVQYVAGGMIVPGAAVFLAQGVLRSMSQIQWLKVASVVLVLGVAAAGVDLLAGWGTPGAEPQVRRDFKPAHDGAIQAVAVRPGKFRVTVSERGVLEGTANDDVFCQVEGGTTILSMLKEGTRVKEGQLVCELDSSAFLRQHRHQQIEATRAEADYQIAKLAREVAEAAVVEYAQGIHKSDLASLQDGIAVAESAVQKAGARLDRTRRALGRFNSMLAPKGGETTPGELVAVLDLEDRLDAAIQTVQREKSVLERARTKREVLEKYTRDKMIKRFQSEVEKAKADDLAKRQAWELAKVEEAKLEKQIKNCRLLAPSDGVVVYANDPSIMRGPSGRLMIEEGATVRERQKVFSLPDFKAMRVNTKVHESLIARIVPGQSASVKVDAFAREVLTGTVEAVYPLADPNSRFSQDIRVFTTHVKIDKGIPGIRPGMSAQVEILVTELDDVLSVPITDVIQFADKDHVAVQKPDGGFDLREVTLGLSNGKRVEVKQGLQSGEVVIQQPLSLMNEEGRRAKFRAPTPPAEKTTVP